MGILTNAAAIILFSLLGSKITIHNFSKYDRVLGIGIMVLSLVGFFENIYSVQGQNIISQNLIVVLLTYMVGYVFGDFLHLDTRLSRLGNTKSKSLNAVIDSTLFFGVGGLQISGPIALVLQGDNTQLFLKSFIDIPFALIFGATYGTVTAISAIPVAIIQLAIAIIAYFSADFFSPTLNMQLCALGYLILFFTGFNLLTDKKHRIDNINILPGMILIILYNIIKDSIIL